MLEAKWSDANQPTGRFRRHPAYKDSGVEWLGHIPSHWELVRSKRLFSLRNVKAYASDRQLTASQAHGVIPQEEFIALERRRVVEVVTGADILKHVEPNDFVISMRSFQGGIEWSKSRGAISSAYVVLAPSKLVDHRYFSFLLKSRPYVQALQSTSNLVRDGQALRFENFSLVDLLLPSLGEQRAIASFLVQEAGRIDALVAKKERLIELLQEKRTALITRAVTKGLDPNVPMKDSGVEWLDEIPKHWNVKPLKAVSELQTGLTLGRSFEGRRVVNRPYIRVANVQDGYLALDDIAEIELPEDEVSRYELREGDVLMTEGGDFDKLGRGYVWEGQLAGCLHQNHIFAVRPRLGSLRSRYLTYAMSSGYGRAYFTATSKQSTNLASTNSTKLRNLPLPLPPLAEQNRIVSSLDIRTRHFDVLVSKVRDAIELLTKLRTTLISAAVTGKIDVRGEVA